MEMIKIYKTRLPRRVLSDQRSDQSEVLAFGLKINVLT